VKRFRSKKAIAILVSGAIVLGGAGAALAYFTASGSGTGQATVGTTGTWSVAQSGTASGLMTPGNGSSTITFVATNMGTSDEGIDSATSVSDVVDTDGSGNITQNQTALPGCLASWFTAGSPQIVSPSYGTDVAPGGTYTFTVNVTMSNPDTNQDVCENATPDVTLSIAS
jgi:hypothetical protein